MTSEVERYQKKQPRNHEEEAYRAGMELARAAGFGGEVDTPEDDPFAHPFFQQGQKVRRQTIKRSVEIKENGDRIITEETINEDVFSFGNGIFQK